MKERIPTIQSNPEIIKSIILGPEKAVLGLEQRGLKELVSNTEFLFAKRGGREPGIHKWARR